MQEIILIVMLGFSPGSATSTSLNTYEYVQPNMKVCEGQVQKIKEVYVRHFDVGAVCVTRNKGEE